MPCSGELAELSREARRAVSHRLPSPLLPSLRWAALDVRMLLLAGDAFVIKGRPLALSSGSGRSTWIILPELVVSALKKEQSRVTGSRKVPSEVPTQTARKGFQKKSFQASAESLPVGVGLTCSLYNLEAAVPGALGFRGDWPQLTTLAQEMVPCTPIRTGYR